MANKKTAKELADEYFSEGVGDLTDISGIKSALERELEVKSAQLEGSYGDSAEKMIADAKTDKRKVYNEALASVPVMRERFANLGLSPEGGKVRTTETALRTALDGALARIDAALASNLGALESDKDRAMLENLSDMLTTLRSEAVRLEKEQYEREQAKIANELEKRRVAVSEGNLALQKKVAAQNYELELAKHEASKAASESKAANDAQEAAVKLVVGADAANDPSYYMDLLKTYASDYLASNGIDIGKSTSAKSGAAAVTLTSDEIRQKVFTLRHMNMSEAEKKLYYERSGLKNYMSYDEAAGK